jgi:2,4-didehydro-3-deoxy-L-rhamnonate hydrolase
VTPFTLATLQTRDGPKAALGVAERFYRLDHLQPLLQRVTCKEILQHWDRSVALLQQMADRLSDGNNVQLVGIDAQSATLLTPILYPDNLIAVGANYSGHLREMGLSAEKWSSMPFFIRPPKTTLVGPGRTVIVPKTSKQFDWECELAIFVGRHLRNASRQEAAKAVAGFGIGLDLSCRDLIQVDNDFKVDLVRGKAQDTMAPCGPVIMPARFVPDMNDLRIRLFVNGEKMMDASTGEMLYKVDEQLSIISEYMTINPGDILFTGSPSGSAAEHGGRWLRPGDRICAEIEHVGALEVTMRDE